MLLHAFVWSVRSLSGLSWYFANLPCQAASLIFSAERVLCFLHCRFSVIPIRRLSRLTPHDVSSTVFRFGHYSLRGGAFDERAYRRAGCRWHGWRRVSTHNPLEHRLGSAYLCRHSIRISVMTGTQLGPPPSSFSLPNLAYFKVSSIAVTDLIPL